MAARGAGGAPMSPILFRASMVGKLMTEPRSKSEGLLSVGAKTAIRDLAAQQILGVDFEVSSREMQKGNECEQDSIDLLNQVRGLSLVKNTERRSDEFFSGECDLFNAPAKRGHDIKTAWSAGTFPILPDDIGGSQRSLYEWQARVYMRLWNAEEWEINYCLVSTPEHLIGYEPMTMHFVDHIPAHHRVTTWTITRDLALEEAMVAKAKAARDYYADVIGTFDRTHPAPLLLAA